MWSFIFPELAMRPDEMRSLLLINGLAGAFERKHGLSK
jgi:hypothetical protein